MQGDFWAQALPILVAVVAMALTALAGAAFRFLLAKAAGISKQTLREAIAAGLAELQRVVVEAIAAVKQTYTDAIKEAAADGKLEKEEQIEAMSRAKKYVESHLGPWALQILQATYGPIGDWLEGYIEAQIGLGKPGPLAQVAQPLEPPAPSPSS